MIRSDDGQYHYWISYRTGDGVVGDLVRITPIPIMDVGDVQDVREDVARRYGTTAGGVVITSVCVLAVP